MIHTHWDMTVGDSERVNNWMQNLMQHAMDKL